MGLDVAFNRKAAEAAGIKYVWLDNGNFDEIADAAEEVATCNYLNPDFKDSQSQDHLEWLRSSVRYIVLPDFPITLVADDSGHDIDIVVRANRWGIVHAPLTKWLVVNDIEYYEY